MTLPYRDESKSVVIHLPGDPSDGHYVLGLSLKQNSDAGDDREGLNLNGTLWHVNGTKLDRTDGHVPSPLRKKAKDERVKVGYIKCYAIDRGRTGWPSNFYSVAEGISDESWEVARMFCDPSGRATRIDHPALASGTKARREGCLLHVYLLELRREHQGKDLGLRMIHEAMLLLRGYWSLAVVMPGILGYDHCKWKENDILGIGKRCYSGFGPEPPALTDGQWKATKLAESKLAVHLGRMGFIQAGTIGKKRHALFITDDIYFRGYPSADCGERAMASWIPKDRAAAEISFQNMDESKPRTPHTDLDKELYAHIVGKMGRRGCKDANDVSELKRILDRGGSIDGAYMMHIVSCMVNCGWLLDILIDLGANVDAEGLKGMTPLHSAVEGCNPNGVRHLLSRGANTTLPDDDGLTPLQYAIAVEQEEKDNGEIMASFQRSDGSLVPMNKRKQDDASIVRRLFESWRESA